jgi:signal peptidase I
MEGMTKLKTQTAEETGKSAEKRVEETPFEFIASICSVLVVGLFFLTFLGQNYVIPSGSMENTLLVGDHVLVDRITLSPPSRWAPFVHYREPKRGDIVVFIKPVPDDVNGQPQYLALVKRLVGLPGDHIHLRGGMVYVNGVPQPMAKTALDTPADPGDQVFLDEFPAVAPVPEPGNLIPDTWAEEFPTHIVNGDLVVPPGKYFMMGDHRHDSADSRFWGFVPRANIVGRPLFNYWSFKAQDGQLEQTGVGNQIAWMAHVALHFFTDTRWSRTFHVIR